MYNEIKNLLFGLGLILISLVMYIFRKPLSKVPPNGDKRAYFTEQQTKNKILIITSSFTIIGIFLMIYSLVQLLND